MLAEVIKTQRKINRLTQEELGKKLGYTTGQFVCAWEVGRASPPFEKLKALSKVLKVPYQDLKEEFFNDVTEKVKMKYGIKTK